MSWNQAETAVNAVQYCLLSGMKGFYPISDWYFWSSQHIFGFTRFWATIRHNVKGKSISTILWIAIQWRKLLTPKENLIGLPIQACYLSKIIWVFYRPILRDGNGNKHTELIMTYISVQFLVIPFRVCDWEKVAKIFHRETPQQIFKWQRVWMAIKDKERCLTKFNNWSILVTQKVSNWSCLPNFPLIYSPFWKSTLAGE